MSLRARSCVAVETSPGKYSRLGLITPLQSLSLMNNSFVQRQADRLAARALEAAAGDLSLAVGRAYERALGRQPTDEERQRAVAAAGDRGLQSVCWALLNSSEFLYAR